MMQGNDAKSGVFCIITFFVNLGNVVVKCKYTSAYIFIRVPLFASLQKNRPTKNLLDGLVPI